jgi:predicted DNA-binding ArsR family transcriptional regulator
VKKRKSFIDQSDLGVKEWGEVEEVERLLEDGNTIIFNGKDLLVNRNFRMVIAKTDENFDISNTLVEDFYLMHFDLKNECEWKSVYSKVLINQFFNQEKLVEVQERL